MRYSLVALREGEALGGDVVTHDSIPSRLFERAHAHGEDDAYFVKENGVWQATSWAGYGAEVRRAAKALLALGLLPGQTVALLGGNRPEWSTFMLAAMAVGARAVGLYTTSSDAELAQALERTEARFVLIEGAASFARFAARLPGLPRLERVITLDPELASAEPRAEAWSAFRELGKGVPDAELRARVEAITPDDVAVLVYTSGTEGAPQVVMLSHQNLSFTADVVRDVLRIGPSDSSLSYLPLSHIAEQMFTVHGPVSTGSAVYYAESMRAAPKNLREVQPTVVFGVPRVWQKLRDGITEKLERVHGPRALVIEWARHVAARVVAARNEGKEPSLELGLQHELAHKLALAKIKHALGLSRARVCLSGAAPIEADTLTFFASLGVQILEVYGQSESCGPITLNQPGRARIGTVGPKLPGTLIHIAGDGEVLVAGPHVFVGYLHDSEASSHVLDSGYLYTGDLGSIDGEGFLTITGRKREILVTAGGKNIAPKKLESLLRQEPLVNEAVVLGDRRRYLCALITLNEDVAHALGLGGALAENAIVRQRIDEHIASVNSQLASVERIKRYAILPRNFSIETGELTPTMKVRRHRVEELWSAEIEALYADKGEQAAVSRR
ncbi:MAG: long-chain fatty acid--CoA ligase [Myxococcaceae bacterium]|nr:long-chain fatty acid--CoA ligase [Myxococcaceae bacterium]